VLAQSTVHSQALHAADPDHLTWEHREPLLRNEVRRLFAVCDVVAFQEVSAGPMAALLEEEAEGRFVLVQAPFTKLATWLAVCKTVKLQAVGVERVPDVPVRPKPGALGVQILAASIANKPRYMPWARLRLGDKPIVVMGFQELACPLAAEFIMDQFLKQLRALVSKGEALVLLAEMNCTPESASFARVLRSGNLRPVSSLTPSSWTGTGGGCLDYVLVSSDLEGSDMAVAASLTTSIPDRTHGSDHVPKAAVIRAWRPASIL
jgi:endonuclease/exonuclease/phosphatase family metal-dependent hydrolase